MSRSRAGARSIGVTLLQGAGRDSRKCLFCPLDCLWMAAARGCRSFFGARHAGRALERLRRCAVGFGYAGRCEGKWCVSVASGELTAERDEWVVFGMGDGGWCEGTMLLLLLLGWGLLVVVQKVSFDHCDACFSSN
jgi:hypothetical protein